MNHYGDIRTEPLHGRRGAFLALLAASALGVAGWCLGAGVGFASGAHALGPTTVTVTMGKPSEFAFTLSKISNLPSIGTVTFKVTNKGAIGHSFKVCSKAVTTAKANACVGVATKVLAKGQSATLKIKFVKKGKYEFLCPVPGHASGGMKGLVGVGVTVSKAEAAGKVTTTTGKTTTAAGGGGGGAKTCASPKTTVVNVSMADFSFAGVPGTLPCGTITFNETNVGAEDHNIAVAGKTPGPVIGPGASASYSITVDPGTYGYQCDVGNHAAQGMVGAFTATA